MIAPESPAVNVVAACAHEFDRHRRLIERAIEPLADEEFFRRPSETVNPIALIVKHLAGNLASRWSDLLSSDGDKPARDRDREFVLTVDDTRANLRSPGTPRGRSSRPRWPA